MSDANDVQPDRAILEFLPDWQERQSGAIRRGGKLSVRYDPSRLPYCRTSYLGADAWDIEVYVRFHPGNQRQQGTLLERVAESPDDSMSSRLRPRPYEIDVPPDAQQVELWFRNYYTLRGLCEAWDSRFGQNYWYLLEEGSR